MFEFIRTKQFQKYPLNRLMKELGKIVAISRAKDHPGVVKTTDHLKQRLISQSSKIT